MPMYGSDKKAPNVNFRIWERTTYKTISSGDNIPLVLALDVITEILQELPKTGELQVSLEVIPPEEIPTEEIKSEGELNATTD